MHPSVVRQIHASRIFHAIRLNPNASQREIADKAETDKSTVSAILKDFEAIGLIERATKVAGKGRGRPGERISISANGGLLVGVHPVPGEISYVVTGLDGAALGQVTRTLPHRSELEAELRTGMGELVASIGRSMGDVRAVGVSVPGLVGRDGHLAHSPNLGWRDLELRSLLANAVDASLYIDNNCNADAMAEYMFGIAAEDETFIYLDSSSGVGAGLFLDGSLFRGRGGYAGEFGHTKIVPNGRLCRCGNCGCLSAYVSDFALAQRLQQDGVQVSSTAEVINMADAGNELALHVLAEMGSYLGIGVSNLINIFDPPRVILGGSLAKLAPFIRNSMIHTVEELALPAALHDCKIDFSTLSLKNVPLGGVALALEGCTSFSGAKAPLWHAPSAADSIAAVTAAT